MATKTFEELKQLAIQIRDEKTNKQNTATRIGTQMLEHLDKLEQDYYDKTATDEELKERDEKLTELEGKIGNTTSQLLTNIEISNVQSGFYYDSKLTLVANGNFSAAEIDIEPNSIYLLRASIYSSARAGIIKSDGSIFNLVYSDNNNLNTFTLFNSDEEGNKLRISYLTSNGVILDKLNITSIGEDVNNLLYANQQIDSLNLFGIYNNSFTPSTLVPFSQFAGQKIKLKVTNNVDSSSKTFYLVSVKENGTTSNLIPSGYSTEYISIINSFEHELEYNIPSDCVNVRIGSSSSYSAGDFSISVLSSQKDIENNVSILNLDKNIQYAGTDIVKDIPYEKVLYSPNSMKETEVNNGRAKKYIPIRLDKSDYIAYGYWKNGYNASFVFYNRSKKPIYYSYVESTGNINSSLKEQLPEELHSVAKFVSLYSINTVPMLKSETDVRIDNYDDSYNGILAGDTILQDVDITYETNNAYLTFSVSNLLKNKLMLYVPGHPASDTTEQGVILYNALNVQIGRKKVQDYKDVFGKNGIYLYSLNDLLTDDEKKNTKFIKLGYFPNSLTEKPVIYYTGNVPYVYSYGRSAFEGLKTVSYGDSVTQGCTWQPQLAELLGMDWSKQETISSNGIGTHYEDSNGVICYPKDGGGYYYLDSTGEAVDVIGDVHEVNNRRTGWSGAVVSACTQQDNGFMQSIFSRAKEAYYYNPDVLILFGGFNDVPYLTKDNMQYIGSYEDKAYFGPLIDITGITVAGTYKQVSFCSSYKGIIEMWLKTCPNAQIICLGMHRWFASDGQWDGAGNTEDEWNATVVEINKQIELICELYSIPFVDINKMCGFNKLNAKFMLSGPHPTLIGGTRIAQVISAKIS